MFDSVLNVKGSIIGAWLNPKFTSVMKGYLFLKILQYSRKHTYCEVLIYSEACNFTENMFCHKSLHNTFLKVVL